MTGQIKNIVFDLGGVLVDIDIERAKQAFQRLKMPQIAELIDAYHPAAIFAHLERGEITFHETCEEIRRTTGRTDVSDEQIARAYTSMVIDVPEAKTDLIDVLRRRGFRTYVLSNNNPASMAVIHGLFARSGRPMEAYFDGMYISCEMGELKPSEAIFRQMIADSGMRPEESLFIDDAQKNVDVAHSLGFAVYMPAPHEDFSRLFDDLP